MKKISRLFYLIPLLLIALAVGQAAAAEGQIAITDIRVVDNQVVIKGDAGFTFTLYNADPYRAIIEIPGAVLTVADGRNVSGSAGIAEVVSEQIDTPTRLAKIDVILQKPATIVPVYADNTLTVRLENAIQNAEKVPQNEPVEVLPKAIPAVLNEAQTPVAAAVVDKPAIAVPVAAEQTAARATEVSGIEVRKAAGSVKVMITGNGTLIPNVFPVNERIVIDIPDVALNAALPQAVASPLRAIRAGKHSDKLRLVLDLTEKTNFDVTAIGNTIEVSLLGMEPAAKTVAYESTPQPAAAIVSPQQSMNGAQAAPLVQSGLSGGEFTGKRISLDFQDADIIPIFRLLAEVGGYNLVVHPKVKGNITLKLVNVPWDQAMHIVMKTFGLQAKIDGNVIRIAPTAELAKELKEELEAKKTASEVGELETRIIPVNYADLNKLQSAIKDAAVLSSRGKISLDDRGSAIIANDLPDNLNKIEALIKEIDQEYMQARQVMIEAKIVEVNVDYVKDLGLQWGFGYIWDGRPGGYNYGLGTSSTSPGPGVASISAPNYLVNLPGPGGAPRGSLGFAYINKLATFRFDLQIQALETNRKAKTLSNPRIMTMNNQQAKITQGQTIYVPIATADKIDYEAVDALLSLTVKPRIAPGGAIFMDLDITKDEPGAVSGEEINILKNTVRTSVLVNNQDTVVIGGIFKQSTTQSNEAVPGLSKIPVLGLLFQRNRDSEVNNEILIFITPTIIEYKNLQ